MRVSEQVAAAAKAWLLDDIPWATALLSQMSDADARAYALLLQAALSLAAGRLFASGYTDGEVIRYVAKVRAGNTVRLTDLDLDPKAAEAVLRHALGKPGASEMGAQTHMQALMALLTVVLDDLDLGEAGVSFLVADAKAQAERWLSDPAPA